MMKPSLLSLLALACLAAALVQAAPPPQAEETFDPRHVMVVVESNNGWGKVERSGLSCDGRFSIVGAYSDTTAIRGAADPDSALALVNGLLALNFFELPDRFGSSRLQLADLGGGKLAYLQEMTMDAGSTRIELRVGTQVHAVMLAYPAYGAPAALRHWVKRYKAFMTARQGW